MHCRCLLQAAVLPKRWLVNAVMLGAGSGTATAVVASGGEQRNLMVMADNSAKCGGAI